jgi:hypothetical protein
MAQFEFKYEDYRSEEESSFYDVVYPHQKTLQSTVTFTDDVQWHNIMREFARFLDATGYVGVNERVEKWISKDWEPIQNMLDKEDYEDTSNTGLTS